MRIVVRAALVTALAAMPFLGASAASLPAAAKERSIRFPGRALTA